MVTSMQDNSIEGRLHSQPCNRKAEAWIPFFIFQKRIKAFPDCLWVSIFSGRTSLTFKKAEGVCLSKMPPYPPTDADRPKGVQHTTCNDSDLRLWSIYIIKHLVHSGGCLASKWNYVSTDSNMRAHSQTYIASSLQLKFCPNLLQGAFCYQLKWLRMSAHTDFGPIKWHWKANWKILMQEPFHTRTTD